MNITDVGHLTEDAETGTDKLEVSAAKLRKDPWQIAASYEKAFFEDIDTLRIRRAHRYPRATEHVVEMIDLVKRLLDRGYAYVSNQCVYYDISKFPAYGQLSGNTMDALAPGARLEINPDKKDPRDFALWITDPKHIMKWPSPWGIGYPYWHVECSAMSMKYLGDTLDIHTGGEDNIFPHHECEIAQSEGATGKPFVRYWVHARFLLVDGRKMSKSLGNFYTLRDLTGKGYSPRAIRYLLMGTHYAKPLNFTLEGISAAAAELQRLDDFVLSAKNAIGEGSNGEAQRILADTQEAFEKALDDDLDISRGRAAIFEMIRELNRLPLSHSDGQAACELLARLDNVLGVLDWPKQGIDTDVERLIEQRQQARKQRDFALADKIRGELAAIGVVLEDTPSGVRWKRI
jgi:cysteinyl-tRNA synthetase